jgi:hypothetical protein
MKSLLKPSINWLLIFVPVAVVLRIWPEFEKETALFIATFLVALMSEFLVGAVEAPERRWVLPKSSSASL